MRPPIIVSLLDTDLYKFTMLQAVLHHFPAAHGEYALVCRRPPGRPLARLQDALEAELDALCQLRFSADELAYLRTLRYIKPDFVDYLELFHLQRRFVRVSTDGDTLKVEIAGPMIQAMFFEIFVLAIVGELYFREDDSPEVRAEGRRRLSHKVAQLRTFIDGGGVEDGYPLLLSDFGTRRRFARDWQHEVVSTLARQLPEAFRGTSNVALARELNLTPIGTMARECVQAFQALGVRLRDFQKAALETWVQEYRGDLGIALTDVVGMDAFLADFDLYFAKLFDGLRHDSGDPFVWGEKAIAHYQSLKIDPRGKMLVFSDALDTGKVLALYRHFAGRAQTSFGVGTHLSNDLGPTPLSIVLKLTRCNGQPVAKLSDSPGKALPVDPTFLAYLRQVFAVPA